MGFSVSLRQSAFRMIWIKFRFQRSKITPKQKMQSMGKYFHLGFSAALLIEEIIVQGTQLQLPVHFAWRKESVRMSSAPIAERNQGL